MLIRDTAATPYAGYRATLRGQSTQNELERQIFGRKVWLFIWFCQNSIRNLDCELEILSQGGRKVRYETLFASKSNVGFMKIC